MMLWDVSRASAFIAFACYTLVVAWGIGLSARAWRPPAAALGFHRFLASLGLVALAIHVATLMLDRYARVTVASLVGLDPRPGVILGAVALWLAAALPLSFRLKQARFMSQRAWRGLHYFGYAVWAAALVHGVMTGTNARSPWAIAVYAVSAAIVVGAAWYRWIERRGPVRRTTASPAPTRPAAIAVADSDGGD